MKCTRRTFLLKGTLLAAPVAAGLSGGILSSLLSSCGAAKSITGKLHDGRIALPRSSVEAGRMVVVYAEGLRAPVCVWRDEEESYTASLMVCTHKECELEPTGNFLTCPCHGSEFSNTGKVMKEPAERDLLQYRVSVNEQHLFIHVR